MPKSDLRLATRFGKSSVTVRFRFSQGSVNPLQTSQKPLQIFGLVVLGAVLNLVLKIRVSMVRFRPRPPNSRTLISASWWGFCSLGFGWGGWLIAKHAAVEVLQRDIQPMSFETLLQTRATQLVFRFSDGYQPQSLVGTFRKLMRDSGLLKDGEGRTERFTT